MKKQILLFFLISTVLSCNTLICQDILWQTSIYLEDARGNKDTVHYGFEDQDYFRIDTSQGEFDISSPWDSVFEVRLVDSYNYWPYYWNFINEGEFEIFPGYTGKNLIASSERILDCHLPNSNFFFIHCKYFPIKISWNSSAFSASECTWGSMIKAHKLDALFWSGWWIYEDSISYACLANEDSIIISSEIIELREKYGDLYYYLFDHIDGVGTDTIWGFQILLTRNTDPYFHPCNHTSVSVNNKKEKYTKAPLYYSNGLIKIGNLDNNDYKLKLYSISGQLIFNGEINKNKRQLAINRNYISSGIYVIILLDENKQIQASKKIFIE